MERGVSVPRVGPGAPARRRAPARVASRPPWAPVTYGLAVIMLVWTLVALGTGGAEALAGTFSVFPALLLAGYLMLTREREVFHPLTFVFLTVFFGVTVQTFYLLYLDQGDHKFALGKMTDAGTLLVAMAAITLGIFFLLVGYSFARRPAGRDRSGRPERWDPSRVRTVVVVCLGIGLASLAYYVAVFDVLDNLREEFAVKRRIIDVDTGISRTLTWVRFGVNFSQLAFFVAFAAYLRNRSSGLLRTLAVLSGVAGIIMPFIASSRLGVVTFVLGAAMIHHFSTGGWPLRRVRNAALVVFAILIGMGSLRFVQTRGIDFATYGDTVSITRMVEPVMGSSNFLAVGKTAVVIESVPRRIDYQYGRTFVLWLVAPIPRSIWPDKPVIRVGAVLGEAIFGTTLRGGVPPGLIGELYLNFSWIGIPFGMLLYGAALARFYERFGIGAYTRPNDRLVYAVIVIFVAFTGLSADFTGMMSQVLQRLVPLAAILYFVSVSGAAAGGRIRPGRTKVRRA